jgi:uncharacterized protein (UPF0147 family)
VALQTTAWERFGFEPDISDEIVQERLKELEEQIKRRMLTEMKIKEGAENLRRVTKDKKSLAHVRNIVTEANNKLHDLNQELYDVRSYLLMTSDELSTTQKHSGLYSIFPANWDSTEL